ncbi:MAG TPA: helix-turn-helix domain-containing protein [Dyadobacter sp.]|nr:helix-turn-helix domain-containing protein [Dyadobacter sp.]
MKQKILHQPFEVYVADMDCWNERPLIYHFFEIVRIIDGTGTRETNRNRFEYRPGSIFLFTPLDCRGFDVETPTRFCSIRFSEAFFSEYKTEQDKERVTAWLKQLETIFAHHNRFEELLIRNESDCRMIASMISLLLTEYEQRQAGHEENLRHLVTLILNIITRNVHDARVADTSGTREGLINHVLLHIQRHIADPEKLRVEYLAGQFNLSPNYVGEYFRKYTGESLQNYVASSRIKLVEQRLTHSNLTISEIANELGYTDESHLSRQFRKHHGANPTAFRKGLVTPVA